MGKELDDSEAPRKASLMREGKKKTKFKVGDILRYDKGSTALMKVTSISPDHGRVGSHRYYGVQFYGSAIGAYEIDCSLATKEETKRFKTDDHLHRLEDVKRAEKRNLRDEP